MIEDRDESEKSSLRQILTSSSGRDLRIDALAAISAKAFIIGYGITFLFPLYYATVGTTMTNTQMLSFPPRLLPGSHAIENYSHILFETTYLHNLVSSLIFAGGSTLGLLVVCAPAGYALAKFDFKGHRWFMLTLLVLMAVPFQLISIPLYDMLNQAGVHDTYLGVTLPALVTPIGVFFMKQNFEQVVQTDMLNSARIDGASELQIFTKIILPIARPGLLALGVYMFIVRMKAYYWPLIMLSSDNKQVAQVWIANNAGGNLEPTQFTVILPAAFLVTFPLLIIFLVGNKYFVRGLTGGSMKG